MSLGRHSKYLTVTDVVSWDFCTGCGMCSVICPVDAISMAFDAGRGQQIAVVALDKCVKCGKCLQVCSGWQVDHAKLNKLKSGRLPANPFLGNYEEILSAWSEDAAIRQAGASGGFVTQLLINLLEDNEIDAALIVKPGETSPLEPEVFLARNREDLVSGQRSCYLNASLCSGLKQVITEKLRIALVALPCQINSILKSRELLPGLQDQIVLQIGLFCNGVYKAGAVQDFCAAKGLDFSQIERIDFRYGDWPGKMRILMQDGREHLYKRDESFLVNYLKRCYFCYDFLSDNADVSVGDNWAENDKQGKNIIILRREGLKKYFKQISFEPFAARDLFETHRLYHSRRRYTKAMQQIASLHGEAYPLITPATNLKIRGWNRLVAWLDWRRMSYGKSRNRQLRRWFLKLRGIIHSNFIYPRNIPDEYVNSDSHHPLILISEGDLVGNKGAVAMVECLIRDIREKNPQAGFIVTSRKIRKNISRSDGVSTLYIDGQLYELALLRAGWWWILKKLGIRQDSLLNNNIIKSYQNADIVISATGISFIDDFGYRRIYYFSRYLLLPFLLGKKVIKFTQSFGPINSKYNRLMASHLLPLADIVMARGRHSVENLKKAGVYKNVVAYPDIALTLQPEFTDRVETAVKSTDGKFIGISPNSICDTMAPGEYVTSLSKILNFIIQELPEMKILLIPHTISEGDLGKNDDLAICRKLAAAVAEDRIKIADTLAMEPGELKALIGSSEFFIGSRYHSLVAAVSMSVPCLAIGWHWKYNELMEWYGLDDNIINIWELVKKDAVQTFSGLYQNRSERKMYLENTGDKIKVKAREATEYINKELLK